MVVAYVHKLLWDSKHFHAPVSLVFIYVSISISILYLYNTKPTTNPLTSLLTKPATNPLTSLLHVVSFSAVRSGLRGRSIDATTRRSSPRPPPPSSPRLPETLALAHPRRRRPRRAPGACAACGDVGGGKRVGAGQLEGAPSAADPGVPGRGGAGGGGARAGGGSRGCSKLLLPGGMHPSSASAASSSVSASASASRAVAAAARRPTDGPFSGLVICVTGLSKEARTQVKEAAERLGGDYSGSLHPKCTHLVVQSFAGRKFEHVLKHGPRNGLFVVTLGWFVDCVRRNMRLEESLYCIKNIGKNGLPLGEFNRLVGVPVNEKSCLPQMIFQDKACSDTIEKRQLQAPREEPADGVFVFTNDTIYIDPGISAPNGGAARGGGHGAGVPPAGRRLR